MRLALPCLLALAACASPPPAPPPADAEPRVVVPAWKMLHLVPGAPSLRGICAVGERGLWVSGQGTVLRSTDGGDSFTNVTPPGGTGFDFRAILELQLRLPRR